MDPKRRRTAVESVNAPATGIHDPLTSKEISFKLLQEIFLNSRTDWWYRCLPADDEYDDIQQATGIEWNHMLPLLIYCGLITFRVDSMVKEGTVLIEQWEELGQAISRHQRLQVSQIRSKQGGLRISFFCLGHPTYHSPATQPRNTNLSLHIPTVTDRQLAVDVKNLGRQIRALRLYDRVMVRRNNGQQEGAKPEVVAEEVSHVEKEIKEQIDYALALDLARRPRLSRTNAGK